ncbi:Bifunctional purine biosynthetic protein ade1 [Hypoxylon texense]
MLKHVVLAALIPVILAKPIVAPRDVAHGQIAEPTAAAQMAGRQVSGKLWDQIAGDLFKDLTPSSTSKAGHAPSVTPFLSRREDDSTKTSTATASTESDSDSESPSSSSSSAAPAMSSMASSSCDCIAECADEHGPPSDSHLTAAQLTCIQSCAQSCDGDDDKAKKSDLLGSLGLSSLGLRQVAPWHGPVRPHYEPPKASMHSESEWQDCMNNCTTHNCQNADIGDNISQCGDTSCEDNCKGFKKESSASATFPAFPPLEKKQFIPPPPGAIFRERPAPNPPSAFASGDFDFGACMQNCTTRNCQNADVGDNISQCGDTSCESECRSIENSFSSKIHLTKKEASPPVFGGPARVKKPGPPPPNPAAVAAHKHEAEMMRFGHAGPRPGPAGPHFVPRADTVPAVPDVPDVPAVPSADGMPDDPTAFASGGAEYDACMQNCTSHNCQNADLGGAISQCGDTSCEQQCRHFKSDAEASVSAPKPEPWHRPLGPLDAATQAARLQSHRNDVKPVAGAEESKEYEDCMTTCKTHNCQSADIGLKVSQCGDTECANTCAKFKVDKDAGIVA